MSDDLLGGRYRLESVLGRGGMAAVWRAIDTRLDRPVAVKVLDGSALTDPAAVERFRREARTVARLTDPHVVSGYDVGSDGDRHYLVMELVAGQSLAELLRDGPLDVDQAVDIAAQVCEALGAAHAAGVVHRDVKPGNILVDGRGMVKVCDFGVARLLDAAQPTLTAAGSAVGTSRYMAPEQVAGEPVDGRTDLYALGCVLYTMLTGAPPFEGEVALSIALQHLHSDPEPIGRRRPDLPGPLAALVDRLLAKDPADRPQSAAEVRAALASSTGRAALTVPTEARTAPVSPLRAVPAGTAAGAARSEKTRVGATRAMAVATPPTRTLPLVTGEDSSESPPLARSRTPWAVRAAIAVVAVFLVGLFLLPWGDWFDGNPGQSAAGPTATGTPAATREAPAVTTAAARPRTDPAGPAENASLADRIAAFRQVVADALAQDRLDARSARDLGKELDKVEKELAEGHEEKALDKTRDVARKLVELRRKGKITDDAWDSFRSAAGGLSVDLPAVDLPAAGRGKG